MSPVAGASSPPRVPDPGERPPRPVGVRMLNPRERVPVSLIIDDSTCLVNLNRFAVPQFADAWAGTGRYQQPWREWPHEIPDAFVRKFGEWCAEHGVRGKYSIVPYPACVGRVDRGLPGWTRRELEESIALVREVMMPGWDIHPEMVTHTRVIDLRTGHPYPEHSPQFQENWEWTTGRSADEIAAYMTYGLRILEEIGLPCEGITTPGGFGTRALPELAQATLQSCREVFRAEIPHYFRHVYTDSERSVAPQVEYAAGLDGLDPRCAVSIIGCTGDWTGGWDCSGPGEPDRFVTPDLESGRMVEVIQRGEPAVMVCHWTGIYFNGQQTGFRAFQEVVRRLHARQDPLVWMKLSEIARYWAARELTRIERDGTGVRFSAPFACPAFTIRVENAVPAQPRLLAGGEHRPFRKVTRAADLEPGTWRSEGRDLVLCFDLPRGASAISL